MNHPESSQPETASAVQLDRRFGTVLAVLTGVLILAVGLLMVQLLFSQVSTYQRLVEALIAKGDVSGVGIALSFTRSSDLAVIKTSAVFLAFMLILLGGLYTFRAGESLYKLAAEGAAVKGSLETASPGLVMMTLGIVIFAVAILKEHTVSLQGLPVGGNPSEATTSNASTSVNTVSAVPSTELARVRRDQIRAINSAIITLDKKRAELRNEEGTAWDESRAKLDSLRRELIIQLHPGLRGRWAEWSARFATDPAFPQSLAPSDKTDFEASQKLLQDTYLPK